VDASSSSGSALELCCVPWEEMRKLCVISAIWQAALKNRFFGRHVTYPLVSNKQTLSSIFRV